MSCENIWPLPTFWMGKRFGGVGGGDGEERAKPVVGQNYRKDRTSCLVETGLLAKKRLLMEFAVK